MIRVYLVEDQALVRDAVAALLGLDFNIEIIGKQVTGKMHLMQLRHLIVIYIPI